jgi:hypothetical protein
MFPSLFAASLLTDTSRSASQRMATCQNYLFLDHNQTRGVYVQNLGSAAII